MRTLIALVSSAFMLSSVFLPQATMAQTPEDSPAAQKLKALAKDLPETNLNVLGIFSNTPGYFLLQEPFWTKVVPDLSMGKIKVKLSNMTELSLSGPEVLRMTGQGLFNIADTIANYGAGSVPELDAMDLPGVATDIDTEEQVIEAYAPTLKKRISDGLGVTALGFGPSLGQVIWCNADVNSISDLKGLKIRGSSAAIANLVKGLGGVPVTMAFSEVPSSLERHVIDCAVTGASSGNSAKLFEVTTHIIPLSFGWAAWTRIVNTDFWNGLDPKVKEWLQLATDTVFHDMGMQVAAAATNQGIWCSTGDDRCTWGAERKMTKAHMALTQIGDADRATLKEAVETSVLPGMVAACGADCAKNWNETVGKVTGLQAPIN